LYNERHNLHSSLNIIRVTKVTWVGYVARIGKMRRMFWFEDVKGGDHFEQLGVDGRKILECV